ncbi:MAG: Iron-binding protein IscA [Alphaproteobacteria bacterium MarineAlpha5_Bin9]|nr:MAG: Iron-binding protein IscA [Alphaproteobacteria bacterium MarineAlpha5_Bin9]|tara:strand:+ start:9707 stop:10051 length:345 start_codon:yes stop_codon:yes gene_type:complete
MNDILTITDKAAEQIKNILKSAENENSEIIGVLVGVDKSGCSGYSYKLEYAKNKSTRDFELIESKGVKVFIDPKATMFLLGSEMDYSSDKLSSRFVFNNPNEKSTCGCGESFNI